MGRKTVAATERMEDDWVTVAGGGLGGDRYHYIASLILCIHHNSA